MVQRLRRTLADLLASLKLLGTLGVLMGFMLANGEGGGGEGGDPPAGDPPASDPPAADPPAADPPKGVTFTPEQQAEVDRIAADRAAKAAASAKKTAADEAKTAAERAKMDEAERLKAEKADVEKKAADRTAAADARVVKAEARAQAAAAGVKGDQLATFLRIVDLDGVTVDDNGDPDEAAIKKAITTALKDDTIKAAFTGGANGNGAGKSGGDHNGNNGEHIFTQAEIAAMSLDEYAKNEATIDSQVKRGLVKA